MPYEVTLVRLGTPDVLAKEIVGGYYKSVVAAGITQATATAISNSINSVDSGTGGVILPAPGAADALVFNNTIAAVNVYPPVGGTINHTAANAAFSLAAATGVRVVSADGTTWIAH